MTKKELYKEANVDETKLKFPYDLNYILQAKTYSDGKGGETFEYDNYMPRKNRVHHGENDITKEELIENLKDTRERMKIAIVLIDKFIKGEIDHFYYWDETSLLDD